MKFFLATNAPQAVAARQPVTERDGLLSVLGSRAQLHQLMPMLLRNDGGNRNRWLSVHLVGTRTNRSGYGAKVYLEAGGKRQLREYGTAGSYLSQSAPEAWFGLGKIGRVEKVEVQWLGGKSQVIENPGVDQVLTITES